MKYIFKVVLITLVLFCLSASVYAGLVIYNKVSDDNHSSETYEVISKRFTTDYVVTEEIADTPEKALGIDFEALKQVNPDVVGWIKADNGPIDYPVVWSADGEKYLKHLFTGEWSDAGCIFISEDNDAYLDMKNTVFFGHNMHRIDTMFTSITYYKDQSYYDTHGGFTYYSEDGGIYRLEPFAGVYTSAYDDYLTIRFPNEASFIRYVQKQQYNSTFKTNVEIEPGDRIVTLSTCDHYTNEGRFALFCKVVPLG